MDSNFRALHGGCRRHSSVLPSAERRLARFAQWVCAFGRPPLSTTAVTLISPVACLTSAPLDRLPVHQRSVPVIHDCGRRCRQGLTQAGYRSPANKTKGPRRHINPPNGLPWRRRRGGHRTTGSGRTARSFASAAAPTGARSRCARSARTTTTA